MICTDNSNFILDVDFGELTGKNDPSTLNARIRSIPGVVETGLFINMVSLSRGAVAHLPSVFFSFSMLPFFTRYIRNGIALAADMLVLAMMNLLHR